MLYNMNPAWTFGRFRSAAKFFFYPVNDNGINKSILIKKVIFKGRPGFGVGNIKK